MAPLRSGASAAAWPGRRAGASEDASEMAAPTSRLKAASSRMQMVPSDSLAIFRSAGHLRRSRRKAEASPRWAARAVCSPACVISPFERGWRCMQRLRTAAPSALIACRVRRSASCGWRADSGTLLRRDWGRALNSGWRDTHVGMGRSCGAVIGLAESATVTGTWSLAGTWLWAGRAR